MELAIKIAPHHVTWESMLTAAKFADSSEVYDQFWNFDHFYPIQGSTSGSCLESWVTLSGIAQATSRIRIGCMVNGMHYRHPAVVSNMASSLDIISAGRFELGLGAGWNEQESSAYGIKLGSLKERFDRFDEGLEVITSLIANKSTTFNGDYYQLLNARNEPKGPQQPLPICIGGNGEKRTLRSVAKYASHWNYPMFDTAEFARKREILAGHCTDLGTEIVDIKISCHVWADAEVDPNKLVEQVQQQREAGINQCIVYFQPPIEIGVIERVTAAVAALSI